MFLAWKEFIQQKKKFSLIIIIVFLISYLVYFLTSLAYGLASSYTNGLAKLGASNIIISKDSNENVNMSMLEEFDFASVETNGNKAKLGITPVVIKRDNVVEDFRLNSYVFGIEQDSFIMPSTLATINLASNEVIVDEEFKKEGFKIDDTFSITNFDLVFRIKAFVSKATYQTAPIIYTSLHNFNLYRYANDQSSVFNAIVVDKDITNIPNELVSFKTSDFYSTLPGYNAQVLTFSIMIVFLVLITAIVLGIFIYVLTIQKTSMFGVMKAQGISSFYISKSVLYQTLILVLFGIGLGFGLTMLSGLFLADKLPFAMNFIFYLAISASFILFSIIGGLFSVTTVLKIDPLKAIGS